MHEHFSLAMMAEYGVKVPQGEVAHTPLQARSIAERLGERGLFKYMYIPYYCSTFQ